MPKIVVDKHREILPCSIVLDRIHAYQAGQEGEYIHISVELYEAIMNDPDIRDRFLHSPKQLKLL